MLPEVVDQRLVVGGRRDLSESLELEEPEMEQVVEERGRVER
jgi:hypothetical protein